MSYRPGIGEQLAAMLGEPSSLPHVTCDGCGEVLPAITKHGDAPMWLLARTAPKGWLMIRTEEPSTGAILRKDYCPRCRGQIEHKAEDEG